MNTITQHTRKWLHKDDNRLGYWLTSPRECVAFSINDLGRALMRASGKVHPAPVSDLGEYTSEWFDAGYRLGWKAGRRSQTDPCKLEVMLTPERADVMHRAFTNATGQECGGAGKCEASTLLWPSAGTTTSAS